MAYRALGALGLGLKPHMPFLHFLLFLAFGSQGPGPRSESQKKKKCKNGLAGPRPRPQALETTFTLFAFWPVSALVPWPQAEGYKKRQKAKSVKVVSRA